MNYRINFLKNNSDRETLNELIRIILNEFPVTVYFSNIPGLRDARRIKGSRKFRGRHSFNYTYIIRHECFRKKVLRKFIY